MVADIHLSLILMQSNCVGQMRCHFLIPLFFAHASGVTASFNLHEI